MKFSSTGLNLNDVTSLFFRICIFCSVLHIKYFLSRIQSNFKMTFIFLLHLMIGLLGLMSAIITLKALLKERDLHRGTNMCFQTLTLLHILYLLTNVSYLFHQLLSLHKNTFFWISSIFFLQKMIQLTLLWVTIILGAYRFFLSPSPTTFVYKRTIYLSILIVFFSTLPKIFSLRAFPLHARNTTKYHLETNNIFQNPNTDWFYKEFYSVIIENFLPTLLLVVVIIKISSWCYNHRVTQNVYYIKQFDKSFFNQWFYDGSEYTIAVVVLLTILTNGGKFAIDLFYNSALPDHKTMQVRINSPANI